MLLLLVDCLLIFAVEHLNVLKQIQSCISLVLKVFGHILPTINYSKILINK